MRPSTSMRGTIGALLLVMATGAHAADRLKILIVDGRNNHPWETTTPILRSALEQTGRFETAVATAPPVGSPASAWDDFRPEFKTFDVVLTNYNGESWPAPVRQALEEYVAGGADSSSSTPPTTPSATGRPITR